METGARRSHVLTVDGGRDEADRAALTPITMSDCKRLHRLFLDREVRRYLLDGHEMSFEWVEEIVRDSESQFEDDHTGLWKIEQELSDSMPDRDPPADGLAGVVGMREFFEPPRMQLIFALNPSAWGRGLAVRSARAVMRYLFEELSWRRIEAATDAPNVASLRVLDRLGFRPFVPDDPKLSEGEFGESLFFEIDAEQFKAAGSAAEQR